MKKIDIVATVLLVIGGLNWGLVGAAHFDLVATVFNLSFGQTSALSSVVYLLVGASAIYQVVSIRSIYRRWAVNPAPATR